MGTIPNGLQIHVLWNMDGRQWIENIHSSGGGSPRFQRALDHGWAKIIPQDKLQEFVVSLGLMEEEQKPFTIDELLEHVFGPEWRENIKLLSKFVSERTSNDQAG
jgi:hypothetical protein